MAKIKSLKFLFHFSLLALFAQQVFSATYYISPSGNDTSGSGSSASPWKTTTKAFAQGGGHTYIYKDGTYNYSGGEISNPPNGTSGAYTIIKAENDGGAILRGFSQAFTINKKSYIQIEGLTIKDGTSSHAIYVTDSDHIKIMRVGVKNGIAWSAQYGNVIELSSLDGVTGTKDCLLEDVWVVGAMRYGILIGGTAGYSERNILRRCIVRFDGGGSPEPHAGISNYGATSGIQGARNNILQNCITIDFNAADGSGEGIYAGFYTPHAATNVDFYGCMAINTRERGWLLNEDAGSNNNDMYNCLIWDAFNEGIAGQRSSSPGSVLDQLTIGSSAGDAFNSYNGMRAAITNSLFVNNGGGITGANSVAYSHFWQDSSAGTNALTSDPLQRYITRVETNSPAYQSGSGGKTRGATIEKKYGVSGTLHGESGYDTLTGDNLWPWPSQQRIHDLFAEPDGISGMPNNNEARGFAASGQSLTNYIWNYLGNGNPYPDVPDTVSPSVSITAPADGSTLTGLVSVGASASDNIGVSKVEFIVNGSVRSTDFSAPYTFDWDTILDINGSFGIQAKAYDGAGNTNTAAITVSINNVLDVLPPSVTLTAPSNGATVSGSVSMTANATDLVGVTKVQFLVDGVIVSTDTTSPYSYTWDSSNASNGSHQISAKAFDARNNTDTNSVNVTVSNSVSAIITASSTWKYLDNGSNQGTAWRATSFNDSSWASGQAELGYGDGDEATVVSYGADANNKHITTYFRRTFTLADASSITSLMLHLRRDDGAVVYLNGTEVLRDNMPAGTISNTTPAGTNTGSETDFFTASVSPALLVTGTNVLAVEIHQTDGGSSDISFDASLIANGSGSIDSTAPSVSLTAPANGATVSGIATLSATASDNVGVSRVEFLVDGTLKGSDTSSPYGYSWTTTGETEGAHTVTARAYDAAGNSSAGSVSVTVNNADVTNPSVSVTAPSNGATVSGIVSVTASASDNVGVARVEIYVDGTLEMTDTTNPYSYSWDTTNDVNGSHTVMALSYDAAGNSASNSVTVTVNNADATPPTISITAPASGATVSGTVNIAANAVDNLAVDRVEISIDGVLKSTDTASPYGYSWNTQAETNGSHTILTRAYDAAGNSASASRTVTVSNTAPDTTNPSVNITAPIDGTTISGTVNVSATAADNVAVNRVQFLVDGVVKATDTTNPYNYSWNTAVETNAGHSVTARAYDAAGNSASHVVNVTVSNTTTDTTNPTISFTAPAGGATVSGTVNITVSAADNVGVARVEFLVDGVVQGTDTVSPFSYNWNTSGESNGSHTLMVRAYDAAGNSASASRTVTVSNTTPDTTAPSVSITAPASGATVSGTLFISGTALDDTAVNRVLFMIDGVVVSTDTSSPYRYSWVTSTSGNGSHALSARAFDSAGNSALSADVTVTVANAGPDITAPSVSLTSPSNGASVSGTVSLAATASDSVGVTRVEFLLDGSLLNSDTSSPYSYNWNTTSASNGSHTIIARAYDAAGNNASSSVNVTVSNGGPADTTNPAVSLTAPANGASIFGTVNVTASASDNVSVARVEFSVDGTLRNSDTASPYAFSLDTTGLSEGSHSISARAYDAAGNSANASITVSVSNSNVIDPAAGGTVSEGTNGCRVTFGPNALTQPAQVTIIQEPAAGKSLRDNAMLSQNMVSMGNGREINFVSAGGMTAATLVLPYDASAIPSGYSASQVRVAYYNPATGKWEIQPEGPVTGNSVQTTVTHFSMYKPVLEVADSAAIKKGESYAFPNPAVAPEYPVIRAGLGDVTEIALKIYDMGGREVHSALLPVSPAGYSSGEAYYDYSWTDAQSSGMFMALIEGRKTSGGTVQTRVNFAVVR